MRSAYTDTKPCKNPRCETGKVTIYSRVEFCGKCQLQMVRWVENNPILERIDKKDVEFLFCREEGVFRSELADYLRLMGQRIMWRGIEVRRRKVGGRNYCWLPVGEAAKVIYRRRTRQRISLWQASKEMDVEYRTFVSYARSAQRFFGRIVSGPEGKETIHVSVLLTFEERWDLARRYFRARKYRKGKPRPHKDALKPWIIHNRELSLQELAEKYSCGSEHLSYIVDGKTVTECFDEDDVFFIDLHPSGCTLEELRDHLETSRDIFDYSVREGKITLSRTVRRGRRVDRYVDRNEMCRIISLMHNRIPIVRLIQDRKKHDRRIRSLTMDGRFGPVEENFSGDLCVSRCFAAGFLACLQAVDDQREPWQHQLLMQGEITSLRLSELLECNHSTTDRWYTGGKVKGRRDHEMIIFSVPDIKDFILEVAAKKVWTRFSLVEPCLSKPPFCEDQEFLMRVKRMRARSKGKPEGERSVIPEGKYCHHDLAEAAEVKPKTASKWIFEFMDFELAGRFKVVGLSEIKGFILGVLRRKIGVEPIWAKRILESKQFGRLLQADTEFMSDVDATLAAIRQLELVRKRESSAKQRRKRRLEREPEQ